MLTLEIHLPGVHSLKQKRMVLQRVRDRLRGKFNVAVAEVDHQDLWQRAVLAVASISSSEANLRQVLDGARAESEYLLGGDLVNTTIEIL